MSLKKMIEIYVEYGVDNATWEMFHKMACHGIISQDTWSKFYNKCHAWYFDEEVNGIVDSETEIVHYLYDDKGHLHKVA